MSIKEIFDTICIKHTIAPGIVLEMLEDDYKSYNKLVKAKSNKVKFANTLEDFIDNNF